MGLQSQTEIGAARAERRVEGRKMGFFAPLYCHFVNYFFVATAIFFVPTAIFFVLIAMYFPLFLGKM